MTQKVILLVEDNPDDEALTLRALGRNHVGNEVVVVRDGQEALDWLFAEGAFSARDRKHLPALILLDLKLPKIDGLEVLRRVRLHPDTSLVPIVILTTSDEEQDRLKSYVHGANSYVRKPIDFAHFMEAVRQLGLYWLVLNQPPPSSAMR
jgi:two-component system, response regulator